MARIDLAEFKRKDKERNRVHSKIPGTYCVFQDAGEKYIQIETCGTKNREMPGQASQFLQFDRETAKFFVDLLIREFDLEYSSKTEKGK